MCYLSMSVLTTQKMKTVTSLMFSGLSPQTSTNNTKQSTNNFSRLPPHVLRIIFSYFDETELKNTIIPVCQRWRETAEDPVLWRKLIFNANKVPVSYICDKIWQFRLVNKIVLRNAIDSKIILRQICRCTDNLTHLILRHCTDLNEESLRYLLTTCKNLKVLDLKGSPFKCLIFYEELVHAKNLEVLNFSGNPYFTVKHIMSVVLNVSKLNGLHISNFKPNDNVLLYDADCYFMLTHVVFGLKYLTLDCFCLSSYTFNSILKCKNLEYLCLNYAFNLEGKTFENMWKAVPKLKTLKIRFAHNVKDSNLKNLFNNGKEVMAQLEVVDFTGCSQIGTPGLQELAEYCPNVRSLVVRNCQKITSVHSVLEKCENLARINIAFCTNLCLENERVPLKLQELFIWDNISQINFANLVQNSNPNLVVRVCQSEFNKVTALRYYLKFI